MASRDFSGITILTDPVWSERASLDGVNLVAFTGRLDRRHGEADFRPERRHDELLAAGLLHRLDNPRVLPGIDEVRSIGFWSGNTACNPLMSLPPRSSTTVVRMVGTLKIFAALASPMTLFTIIIGSWLCRFANWKGW